MALMAPQICPWTGIAISFAPWQVLKPQICLIEVSETAVLWSPVQSCQFEEELVGLKQLVEPMQLAAVHKGLWPPLLERC